ncbi:caffeine-induced death protein 2 [Trichoderma guizhouense]|uniref:Caffeine-induced death protein 2 n=1 Tax=Trichoderma guizhouense TaxID=1491466 RepID=A0A1T3CH61_9HYPO|nr:caffeine-induced death protein 2 [Trichoderma guizhouense]
MSQPPGQPRLSPQFCFSFGTLRDFLRLSRSSIDDSITQNLNALVTPARTGFDPSSTSKRAPRSFAEPIDPEACQSFKEKVLFPSWKARAEVLSYCGIVATSPDPDDPEATILELEKQRDRERIVDERLDPYSGRFFPREARTQSLALLMRQERAVENIVRSRTWDVIQGRCGTSSQSWQDAMSNWEASQKLSRGDGNPTSS